MKVSLVRCPCINLPHPPPIGLTYLKSFLRNTGHEVYIFDLNIELFHLVEDEMKKRWNDPYKDGLIKLSEEIIANYNNLLNDYIKKILETGATLIGFSVWDSNIPLSLKIAREIKKIDRNIIVIFGGPECFPRWSGNSLIEEDCIDVIIYGEGEETLNEIIESLECKGEIGRHAGTIIKRDSKFIDCGVREPIKDLDKMPFPDFDGFPLDKYINNYFFIVFNRGFSRRCTYCSGPGTIPQYRWRNASSIYEEMTYQLGKYPHIDKFHSSSPALNSNLKELSKLCNLIIKNNLKVSWSGFAIIDREMVLSLLKKMKESGCFGLNFGMESGSQKIVDKMRKGFRIEDAEQNFHDAYNVGIEIVANFIIGFPGETEEDFQQTLDFILHNQQYISFVGVTNPCYIEPYMYLSEHVEEFGITLNSGTQDWYCKETNYQIRKERENRFKEFINSHNMGKSFPKLPKNQ